MCCHQKCEVPKHPLLVPIQVGAALADRYFPGFLHDDAGENISAKNRSYCELTAHYWAWKNVDADFYGIFHYRRYLYPDASAKRPYRLERVPDLHTLERLGYEGFREQVRTYDIVVPKGENMFVPVRKHYADAKFHHEKDLRLVEEIVREKYPAYVPAMEEYLDGTICYFGNICILRKPVFQDYCQWLFDILREFDRRADVSGYSVQERRVDGYLAERLLGIYVTSQRGRMKILELPRVHFLSGREYVRQRAVNALLPPGTRRRCWVKRTFKKDGHER